MLKKRLLVLTPQYPYPVVDEDRLRLLHLCNALRSEFRITLLSLCHTPDDMAHRPEGELFESIHRVLLPRWRSWLNVVQALPGQEPLQVAYYASEEFRNVLQKLTPHHDAVLAHQIVAGQYLTDPRIPRILELTSVRSLDSLRLRHTQGVSPWKKLLDKIDRKKLHTFEKKSAQRFDRVWVTSQTERSFLDPQHKASIDIIPNGVDLRELPYRPPADPGNVIAFLGDMESRPNQEACRYFLGEVLPLVRKQAPVRLRIIGNAPESVRRRFSQFEGVEFTGHVENLADHVAGAFCGVCPVREETGPQSSVLQYLALGLPCVSSSEGLSGVDARSGTEALVFRDSEEAAAQILMLHSNTAFRLRLAWAGRQLVGARYDWETIYRSVLRSCVQTVERHPAWRIASKRHRPAA